MTEHTTSERERLQAALDRHWKAWGEAMEAADVAKEAGDDAAEDAARRAAGYAVGSWFHYSAALRDYDRAHAEEVSHAG